MCEFSKKNLALKLILNVSLLKAFLHFSSKEREITSSLGVHHRHRNARNCSGKLLAILIESYFKMSDSDFMWE